MTVPRLVAVIMILVVAAGGWFVLGASVDYRTNWADDRGGQAVGGLWGRAQHQQAPTFTARGGPVSLVGSDIEAVFELDQRKKGLLWYSTYVVDLTAAYRVRNESAEAAEVRMTFLFPQDDGVYDGFAVVADGAPVPVTYESGRARADFAVAGGSIAKVETGYVTSGLDEWRYDPTPGEGVGVIEDFTLTMRTDFRDIDFPGDAVSPTTKEETDDGWLLVWDYGSLVSGRQIGLAMPTPLNPGPVASRIAFFAPVSLLFFFAALVLLTATAGIRVHPMNYAFLAAGFFAFHLLFAYLVDRIDIHLGFAIASVTSVLLCVGYLRMVLPNSKALV